MRSIEEIVAVFRFNNFRDLQNLHNLWIELSQNGFGFEEFDSFMSNRKDAMLGVSPIRCPECRTYMRLYPGDSEDSQWVCPKCRFSTYNDKSISEVQKELLEESRNGD